MSAANDVTPTSFAQMMDLDVDGVDTFVGIGPRYPWGGLYGGQIVAQALRAAGMTVDPAFLPHSLHGYFIRPGDHTLPVRFEVERLRDGRSFVTRSVVARQTTSRGDLAIFNMSTSFQTPEDAVDVTLAAAPPALSEGIDGLESGTWSHVFDRRQLAGRTESFDGTSTGWFRMADDVGDDPVVRACALAYLSDDLPTEAVVASHPTSRSLTSHDEFDTTFQSASLDHAIWFHRDIDPAAWHLHHMNGTVLTGNRGLSTGEIFAADGTHAATVTQEVLLRVRR